MSDMNTYYKHYCKHYCIHVGHCILTVQKSDPHETEHSFWNRVKWIAQQLHADPARTHAGLVGQSKAWYAETFLRPSLVMSSKSPTATAP